VASCVQSQLYMHSRSNVLALGTAHAVVKSARRQNSCSQLYERELLPLDTILECSRFLAALFSESRHSGMILVMWFAIRTGIWGHLHTLELDNVDYLLQWSSRTPTTSWWLLHLWKQSVISVHYITIHVHLKELGSRVKAEEGAAERNERLRADFIGRMAKYEPESCAFLTRLQRMKRGQGCLAEQRTGKRKWKGCGGVFQTEALSPRWDCACHVVEGSIASCFCILESLSRKHSSSAHTLPCAQWSQPLVFHSSLPQPSSAFTRDPALSSDGGWWCNDRNELIVSKDVAVHQGSSRVLLDQLQEIINVS